MRRVNIITLCFVFNGPHSTYTGGKQQFSLHASLTSAKIGHASTNPCITPAHTNISNQEPKTKRAGIYELCLQNRMTNEFHEKCFSLEQ